MNSNVIKFVAGAGKTTSSIEYLNNNPGGIYLAFTNSVIDEVNSKGMLGKTIDSFFANYIIPKFTTAIPLLGSGSVIRYIDSVAQNTALKGIGNIRIDIKGNIFNKKAETGFSLSMINSALHEMRNIKNAHLLQYIFGKDELRLTDCLRENLSDYIIENYSTQLLNLISSRFSYVIIDEAQDLKGYRERFAQLLYDSKDIYLILLGDENQNINGGGAWFEEVKADHRRNKSYRCPENNCEWIRNNLDIQIYGNNSMSSVTLISIEQTKTYDDGARTLLYSGRAGVVKDIVDSWHGPKMTIKSAKGSTINEDVVIVGKTLNKRNMYTAITRTRGNVYTTVGRYCLD